jgi:hypothetical protein
LTSIENYASVPPVPAKKLLLQTHVSATVFRKFDALARAAGNTHAGYLRHLIELHTRALRSPRLARALGRCRATPELEP